MGLFTKLFGTYSEREIKKLIPIIDKTESLAEEYKKLSEEELKNAGAAHFCARPEELTKILNRMIGEYYGK